MNEEGFIRLSRKAFRCDLWREEREFSRFEAWLDLIASASFATETVQVSGRCLSLQRGELAASVRYLARRWRWSKSKAERFLAQLSEVGRIETRTETGLGVVKLCNYERFNALASPKRDSDGDSRGTVAGQSRDKLREGKEVKNGGCGPPPLPSQLPALIAEQKRIIRETPDGDTDLDRLYERLWQYETQLYNAPRTRRRQPKAKTLPMDGQRLADVPAAAFKRGIEEMRKAI